MANELIRVRDAARRLGVSYATLKQWIGQLTDRHFAHYLGIARGSALETRGHRDSFRLPTPPTLLASLPNRGT